MKAEFWYKPGRWIDGAQRWHAYVADGGMFSSLCGALAVSAQPVTSRSNTPRRATCEACVKASTQSEGDKRG